MSLQHASQHLILVSMGLPAGDDVRRLQLPVWNALYQIRDFSQYVRWVRAKDSRGDALAVRQINKSCWQIEGTRAGGEVEYEIFADDAGPFGAQLNDHHAFLNLAQILMYDPAQRGAPIHLEISGVPRGWQVATALRGEGLNFAAENYDELADAPVELGQFQQADFDEDGGHYRVVVDGDRGDYDLQTIVESNRKIVAAETRWMNDRPFASYLFIYHVARVPAGGGMEHANSTAIDIDANRLRSNPLALADVTAHEFFHLWNVKRIRPESLCIPDYTQESDTEVLWLSEGVTSTVAAYARLQAGLLDDAGFLSALSEQIQELELRPAHLTQSVQDSGTDAWLEKYDAYRSPERSISYYNKGYLLGVLLDLQMREATQGEVSLRELFQSLNRKYAQQGRCFAGSPAIEHEIETLTNRDFGTFFRDYVAGSGEIPWDRMLNSVGLRLLRQKAQVADPGFIAVQNFNDLPTVSQVTSGSLAERAGLKPGDAVESINSAPAGTGFDAALHAIQPGELLRLRVRSEDGERDLSWRVGHKEQVEFKLADVESLSASQTARRAAWLHGQTQPEGRR